MLRTRRVTDKDEGQLPIERLFSLLGRIKTKKYTINPFALLKDISIATLTFSFRKNHQYQADIVDELIQLRNQTKDLSSYHRDSAITEGMHLLSLKHRTEISFFYPRMNPVATNTVHLKRAHSSTLTIKQRLQRTLMHHEARLVKTKSIEAKRVIEESTNHLIAKAHHELGLVEKEISNRTNMLAILSKLTMPNSLKNFMYEINQLSLIEKQGLVALLSHKEQLLSRRNFTATPYELMYVYDPSDGEFMVGLRSHYDHDHPHTTVKGGEDPEVIVAGTIDLKLEDQHVKIAKVRIDSGHYRPDAESIEIIMRYLQREMSVSYCDEVVIGIIENDVASPEIKFKR